MDTVNINNIKKGHTKAIKISSAASYNTSITKEKNKTVHNNTNKENLIPIEEKSNDARSELESSGPADNLINSNQHIKLKKKPSKLNLSVKKAQTPFTPDSKRSDPREFEPIQSDFRKSLNRTRSISDPKNKQNKTKVRPVKMEKQISATELFRSIPVKGVLKRRKTVNSDIGKPSKSGVSFYQVKMDFTLEEMKNLPNLTSNSVTNSLYYYYTWQVDNLSGDSGLYQLEDNHIKWKKEGFSIDVVFSGCLEKKIFSPKILKLFFKQHLGSYNIHGNPIISDCDMVVADYCLNLAPFVSTIPEDPIYESVRLQQKTHSYYDLTPSLQFEVRSKRIAVSSKEALLINHESTKNNEIEASESHKPKKPLLIRTGSKSSLFGLARSKTEITIPDNSSMSETCDPPKSHRPSNHQYTKQLEEKIRILEMKVSQAIQQTHTTNNMYEELLKEVEKPTKLNTAGISNLFPIDPTEQNSQAEAETLHYNDTNNVKQAQLTTSSEFEDGYRSLMKDYYKIIEQKESVMRNCTKLTEENRRLKTQNQELNDQLLTVLNDHYKLLSLQLSENSGLNNISSQNLLDHYSNVFDYSSIQSKHKDKNTSSTKQTVKELVINFPGTQTTVTQTNQDHTDSKAQSPKLEKITSVGDISDTSTSWVM